MYLEILVYENKHEAYYDNIVKIICNSPPIARLGPLPRLLALRCPSDTFEVFPECGYLSVAYKPPAARQKFLAQVLVKRVAQTSQLLDPMHEQKKENSYPSMLLALINKFVLATLL